jgi:tRNA (cmo5U34)-methyltransferase
VFYKREAGRRRAGSSILAPLRLERSFIIKEAATMQNNEQTWQEADSRLYQEIAQVAVPARAEQIAVLLTLLPFDPAESFRVVEIGCGEGRLAQALLHCFPQAEVLALDGSAEMRSQAEQRLARFGLRARVAPFDLFSSAWHAQLAGGDAVLSSLCLHHLSGPAKQHLFSTIYQQLAERGALLIADLVEPQRPEARELFAATWDRLTRHQAQTETGAAPLYEKFVEQQWNYYRFPDPVDQPSGLFEQLLWLKQVGFAGVDCFWLQAGHAIYGGYKSSLSGARQLNFETALAAAYEVSGEATG